MAHLKNYTAASVAQILAHNSRSDHYSNQDIDPTRSKYNYSLSGHDNDLEYYKQRLGEVHHMKRANLNTLSSWVITMPKGVRHEDQQKFFSECVNFIAERYGEKNLVSADVHYDETTPHLHCTFIPVVWDEKKRREKVSRRDLFTLKELYGFHGDLSKHMEKALGYTVGIQTGKTEKNLSIRELKTKTKTEIIEEGRQIANKYVTDAVKEACSIKDKAEAEKRKSEVYFAEKAAAVRQHELTDQERTEARKLADEIRNKKHILGRVWFPVDKALKILDGLDESQKASSTLLYVDKRADNLQDNDIDRLKREQRIAILEDQVKYLLKKKAEQEKLLIENGIIRPPMWQRTSKKGHSH